MNNAVIYRWKIKPDMEELFTTSWAEGTRRIHKRCGSFGARLHRDDDGLFWSYALWPSEDRRQSCMAEHDWSSMECFKSMQACIEERLPETLLTIAGDQLDALPKPKRIPVLMTDRLHLRAIRESDAPSLYPALGDAANMRYWSSDALGSASEAEDYLQWNVHGDSVHCFAINTLDAPDRALGWVTLIFHPRKTAEIGFILRPDAQGHGYALEAAQAILKYGFETRGLRRIFADVDPDNKPSIKLIEALGLRYEGRLRAAWETHIGVRDSLIYARLATD